MGLNPRAFENKSLSEPVEGGGGSEKAGLILSGSFSPFPFGGEWECADERRGSIVVVECTSRTRSDVTHRILLGKTSLHSPFSSFLERATYYVPTYVV